MFVLSFISKNEVDNAAYVTSFYFVTNVIHVHLQNLLKDQAQLYQ